MIMITMTIIMMHMINIASLFEGVCLTTVVLAPDASEGECELPAKSHFALIVGIGRRTTRGHFFCAGIALDSMKAL